MAKKPNEQWLTIEDLLAEANKVNEEVFVYRGRALIVPWQELRLDESPSFTDFIDKYDPEAELSTKDMVAIGEKLTEAMAFKMIVKGQTALKRTVWTQEQWDSLPLTLRKEIVNKITVTHERTNSRF